jgi:hypothetical protein
VLPVPDRGQARLGGQDGDDQPELVGRQRRLQPVRHVEPELAVAVHTGTLADVDQTYGALGIYVAEREIDVGGPIREQYLVTPFDTEDESDLVTEVCWPVIGAVTSDLA